MKELEPIEFDWKEGTASVVWESPTIGLVRFHNPDDESETPLYRGVCLIKVTWGEYEFKALTCKPTKEEHKAVRGYLESLGLRGFSRRVKDGKVVVKRYRGTCGL